MEFQHIRLEVEPDGVAVLTVNRPERRNALSHQTVREMGQVVEAIARREGVGASIRALIITGSGDKAFVSGADIEELSRLTPVEGYEYTRQGQAVLNALEALPVPVIAAVNGYALGGGCELALACHIRLACPEARFGQPEVRLGIIPGYGGTQRLPRIIGKGRALEWILTGAHYTAEEAYRIGLVNRIVPRERLLDEAKALARQILANGPVAVRLALRAVQEGLEMPLEMGLLHEASLFALTTATEDMREGTRAFLEKREPRFQGR
jgi:enoyl-CoA hydratase